MCLTDLNLANYKTAVLTGSKHDLVQSWPSFQGDMPNLNAFTLCFRRALLLWLKGDFLCLRTFFQLVQSSNGLPPNCGCGRSSLVMICKVLLYMLCHSFLRGGYCYSLFSMDVEWGFKRLGHKSHS